MTKVQSAILSFTLALLPAVTPLHASVASLYSGEVPVENQSSAEQRRATPVALEQVLQKLSGVRDFEPYPGLGTALHDARAMAVSFYYSNREVLLTDGSKENVPTLVVNFSRQAVDELLQQLLLPSWKPERKPLTVWLVVDDGVDRRIMPIELEYAWQSIALTADERGMPVIRPQPDPEGNYPVDLQLLWGGYTEELVETGPADALVFAARREGPEWNVRVNLDYTGQTWTWRNRDTDLQLALIEGMQTAIDEIAAINSIAAADQSRADTEITVTGVTRSADYVRVMAYLQSLSLVDRVVVTSAASGKVSFQLFLNALPEYLLKALDSGGTLNPTAEAGVYLLSP